MKGMASAKGASKEAQQERPTDLRAVSHLFMTVFFYALAEIWCISSCLKLHGPSVTAGTRQP